MLLIGEIVRKGSGRVEGSSGRAAPRPASHEHSLRAVCLGRSSALWRPACLTLASEPTGGGPLPRWRGQPVLDDEALVLIVDAVVGRDEQHHLLAQLEADHNLGEQGHSRG